MNLHAMHPSIGALHAKETLFDHRLATPQLRTRSDSGGKFELSGVKRVTTTLSFLPKAGAFDAYQYQLLTIMLLI